MTNPDAGRTDTPETDALIATHAGEAGLRELAAYYNQLLDFARRLERERAESRLAECERLLESAAEMLRKAGYGLSANGLEDFLQRTGEKK